MNETKTRLVVFSDDWGRHPSSCQHLVGKLVGRHRVLWVNTIGTRGVSLTWHDFGKVVTKLRQWTVGFGGGGAKGGGGSGGENGRAVRLPEGLAVAHPWMWPGFRKGWQRRLNAKLVSRAVNRALGRREPGEVGEPGEYRVAVTTLPITADLVGRLEVDRWVYYCVDDFAVWPGLDGTVMRDMERELVGRVDAVVAASQAQQEGLAGLGRDSVVLTHGIDLEHWALQTRAPVEAEPTGREISSSAMPGWWPKGPGPIILFWGLIDRRLDTSWCEALVKALQKDHKKELPLSGGRLVLVGPSQSPDPAVQQLEGVVRPGPVSYDYLPLLAAGADVLVMPYADLPVTRAMQPLKFKEYLATGKPVVARALPATRQWADAADVVETAQEFVERVGRRASGGLPGSQRAARGRLATETWEHKAEAFETILFEKLRK